MDLLPFIGNKIRELRLSHAGGISQEELANNLEITPNTVSRWETATYKPDINDLERLSRFFKVSVLEFFPKDERQNSEPISALLRAAQDLDPADLEELKRYAEFRKARSLFQNSKARHKNKK